MKLIACLLIEGLINVNVPLMRFQIPLQERISFFIQPVNVRAEKYPRVVVIGLVERNAVILGGVEAPEEPVEIK